MRRLPIRLRLTLVYAAALAVVLAAVGVFAYLRLSAGFAGDLDRELRQRAQDISGPLSRPGSSLGELLGRGFIEHGESFAELVRPDGSVLQSTGTLRGAPLLRPAQAGRAAASRTFVDLPNAPGLNEPARVLATPFRWQGRDAVLVVGATRENGFEALAAVRSRMLLAGPLILLVSSLMAYTLAAAALRPVERMRRQAARMTATTPGERLLVPPSRDEIARLAGTLNDLLGKVDASVERERRFVANASHELRTPLAVLRTELDLATRRERSRPELRATVDSASVEVDRLVALANDLLVLARESDGDVPLVRRELSTDALLASYTGRDAARRHDLKVLLDPAAVSTLCVDEVRLRQALDNLIDNAGTHGGAPVELCTVASEGAVELHVRDRGPGFDPDMLDRAFDRFAHSTGSRGSGLGLAIVAQIAKAHAGYAGIANRPGGGADTWIGIPVEPPRTALHEPS